MASRRLFRRSLAPRRGCTTVSVRLRVATLLVVSAAGLVIGVLPAAATETPGPVTSPSLRAAAGGGTGHLRAEPAAPVVEGRAETCRGAARSAGPTTTSALPTDQPSAHPTARALACELRYDRATAPAPIPEPELSRPPPSSI